MTEYGLIPIPASGPEREAVLANVIAYGGSDEMLRKFFDCEATEQALALQLAQATEGANRVADIGMHLMDRVEDLVVREQAQARADAKRRADKARRDAEAEARAEAAELRDWLAENPEPGASAAGDDTHQPSGELHILDPVDKEHLEASEDDQGALPAELEEGAPPSSGTYTEPDPEDLGGPKDPRSVPQPASTSFW
jgi:hypothetical protein